MALKWMLGTAAAALIAASPAVSQTTTGSQFGECALEGMSNERFTELDRDRDNGLTMEEYRECLTQAGVEMDEQQTATFEAAYGEADADGNQQLAFAEVQTYGQQHASGVGEDVGAEGKPRGTITVTQPAADVTVRQPSPDVTVTQQEPTVNVQPQAPQVAVETPEPEVNVTQPEPQVAVSQPEPEVSVTQPEAQIAVSQPEPEVAVQAGQPAVAVEAAEPEVAVATPEPEVAVEQPELDVNVQQAQPDVAVQQEQPEVAVRRSGSAEVETETETAAAPASTETDATGTATYQVAVDDIVGRTVYNAEGEEIGDVQSVMLDPNRQAPVVVVKIGGFLGLGGRQVAMPYDDLSIGGDRIVLDTAMTEDEIKAMPQYEAASYQDLPENMMAR